MFKDKMVDHKTTPEQKLKRIVYQRRYNKLPSTKERLKIYRIEYYQRPKVIVRQKEYSKRRHKERFANDPSYRKRIYLYSKQRWKLPEQKKIRLNKRIEKYKQLVLQLKEELKELG